MYDQYLKIGKIANLRGISMKEISKIEGKWQSTNRQFAWVAKIEVAKIEGLLYTPRITNAFNACLLSIPEGRFEIEDFTSPCYIYECVAPLRTLLLQKTSPKKFKKVSALKW